MALTRCCICLSLRTGTIIIAILSTFGALFCLGSGLYAAAKGNFLGADPYLSRMVYYGISLIVTTNNAKGQPVFVDRSTDYYSTAKILIPSGLLMAAIQILFLYGAIKKVPKLFLPWLIWQSSWMVVGFFSIVLMMVVDPFALISLLGVLIHCYFLSVVWYYYQELKHTQKLDQLKSPTAPQEISIKF